MGASIFRADTCLAGISGGCYRPPFPCEKGPAIALEKLNGKGTSNLDYRICRFMLGYGGRLSKSGSAQLVESRHGAAAKAAGGGN